MMRSTILDTRSLEIAARAVLTFSMWVSIVLRVIGRSTSCRSLPPPREPGGTEPAQEADLRDELKPVDGGDVDQGDRDPSPHHGQLVCQVGGVEDDEQGQW